MLNHWNYLLLCFHLEVLGIRLVNVYKAYLLCFVTLISILATIRWSRLMHEEANLVFGKMDYEVEYIYKKIRCLCKISQLEVGHTFISWMLNASYL